MSKTIFVIGMDDFNRGYLDHVERQTDYSFRPLFGLEEVRARTQGDAAALVEEAKSVLDDWRAGAGQEVDGIVAYWDFPVQTLVPILRSACDLPSPSLESVLKCEHKVWSRLEQRRVIPDHVPDFTWFDPFDMPDDGVGIDYPFWMKPVKGTNSELGFLIRSDEDLGDAVEVMRREAGRFGRWFDQFLAWADLPDQVREVSGAHCLAEAMLGGTQHTLSGWADGSSIQAYGVVDSDTYPERSSFASYRYPSRLPQGVQQRMADIGTLLMEHFDFRHEAFNIEFFYDAAADRLMVLEVNPRFSQSHGDLYLKVDGMPNHKIAADLAIGRMPDFPARRGRFPKAAKFYVRHFGEAVVTRVPTEEEVRRVEREIPGATVVVGVAEGDRLDSVQDRDSYSFALANVYLGAADDDELDAKFERVEELLPFAFDE